jgi:hypothetical protein
MDDAREDRIYELQQALALLPPAAWGAFLSAACPGDAQLTAEILSRQLQIQSAASPGRRVRLYVDAARGAAHPDPESTAPPTYPRRDCGKIWPT